MSGVNRLFSRREKKNPFSHKHAQPAKQDATRKPDLFDNLFSQEPDPNGKTDKEEERKVGGILERLRRHGVKTMVEANARYALRTVSPHGDADAAYRLLMLLQETFEGEVKPYNPTTVMAGAINRGQVTCYLDSLLFSMFSLLDSFEAMLYDNFSDDHRKRLAGLLRLWVNMLRTGRLVTTDVTGALQDALASCGWEDAARARQQDPSEAFTFITGQLELPLLTLKMDLYHTGKEDPQDDHKFVNERLLEVAIPEEPAEGSAVITLEECLENYFNNRIEVKRFMENKRRNTLKSASLGSPFDDFGSTSKIEKETGVHVEVAELSSPNTPLVQTPTLESPHAPLLSKDPLERLRPGMNRKRADSIFSQRTIELFDPDTPGIKQDREYSSPPELLRERKSSTRTEVLMPAWQFFKLLPWYTDHMPESDAQVAAHFSNKRPVLGICLKRYSYTNSGEAVKRDTYVDIPLEIAVPDFVSDEHMKEDGPLVGNFRLLLMSVVCHRGVSVHSGHYISLCRAARPVNQPLEPGSRRASLDSDEFDGPWMRFDDLAAQRVTPIHDVHEALKNETPYLLFYQVQPIDENGIPVQGLPTYAEATSRSPSDAALSETPYLQEPVGSEHALSDSSKQANPQHNTDNADFANSTRRASVDTGSLLSDSRGRSSLQSDERRHSVAFGSTSQGGSVSGGSIPTSIATTPSEEKDKNSSGGFLSVAAGAMIARRASRRSKSRPSSVGPDGSNRLGVGMTKLTQKLSRGEGNPVAPGPSSEPPPATSTTTNTSANPSVEDVNQVNEKLPAPARATTPARTPAAPVNANREAATMPKPVVPQTAPVPSQKREKAVIVKQGRTHHHHHHKGKVAEDRGCVVM